ncbi:Centrobin [Dissostichus eleginoides]|uniref:Centrobin n=1 Tax=Dissostichus eleginoides TaxID=100907 RepID=A0AAD9CBH8_DISEL|nr:Centrobin [Dissostichus eleginoides]
MTFLMSCCFARGVITHLLSTRTTEQNDFIRRVVPKRGRKRRMNLYSPHVLDNTNHNKLMVKSITGWMEMPSSFRETTSLCTTRLFHYCEYYLLQPAVMQSPSLPYTQSNSDLLHETAGCFYPTVENNMLEWQNEAEAYKLLCQETHTNTMKEALEMERQSLTSEREAFQRECAQMTEKRNALQLEKKHKKVFEKEMAMTRAAIIKEKSDIQTMRVAFQTEKVTMEKEREEFNNISGSNA